MCFFKKGDKYRKIEFLSPAQDGSDFLVTGNGETALLVFDGVRTERLVVYRADYYYSKSAISGDFACSLNTKSNVAQIKRNLAMGNYSQAEKIITNALLSSGFKDSYATNIPLCELVFNFSSSSLPYSYSRQVCLNNGTISSLYKMGQALVSRKACVFLDGTICFEVKVDFGTIDCDITLCSQNYVPIDTKSKMDFQMQVDGDYIIYSCSSGACKAGLVCFVMSDGAKSYSQSYVKVKAAQSILVFAQTFSLSENAQDTIEKIKAELKSFGARKTELDKEKTKYFSSKLYKCELKITKNSSSYIERELLDIKSNDISISLLEDMYYYGKYLAVSLGQIAIKSDSFLRVNDCQNALTSPFDFDKTQQKMLVASQNYLKISRILSFSIQNGMDLKIKDYLSCLFQYIDDFRANAINLFGIDSAFVPSVMAHSGGQIGTCTPDVIFNKNFGASIFDLIYRYYVATGDKDFMEKEGYIFASSIAQFFLSGLKLNKANKTYDSPFGLSPFSWPKGHNAFVTQNTTVDFENCKYIFYCMSKLSFEFEGQEASKKWHEAYSKVPDIEVDKDGNIKEFALSGTRQDSTCPNVSHTFPYNIGCRAMDANRDYDALIQNSVKYRFASSCGKFSSRDLVEMALALATCGDGDSCFYVLLALCRGFLTGNLMFSSCDISGLGIGQIKEQNYLNIDVNTALCACLQNMFLTASEGNIYLFRSLPKRIENVSIKGFVLKSGITLDININAKRKIVLLKIYPSRNDIVSIFVPDSYKSHIGTSAKIDLKTLSIGPIELKKNKVMKVKIFY